MLMWILTVLAIITGVKGYADGYFPQVCDSMEVQHNSGSTPINPQNSELPYKIEIHPPTGQQIRVTLKADPGHYFRGFMLEARRPNTNAVGTFIVADTSLIRLLTCNNVKGSAVSNHNNRKKDKVEVDWISDGQDQDIFFRATFVETYSVFWRPNDTEVISLTTTPKPSTGPGTTTLNTTTNPVTPTEPSTSSSTIELTTTATTELTTTATTELPTTATTELSATATTELNTTANTELHTTATTELHTTATTELNTTATTELHTTATPESSPSASSTVTDKGVNGNISPSPTPKDGNYSVGVAELMTADLVVENIRMGNSHIITLAHPNSPYSFRVNKVSKICFGLLCAALEISVLIIVCVTDPDVTVIALVSVVIGIHFIKLVICCLPIGRTHELKEICDIAVEVCSVFHNIFTIAFIFVVVMELLPLKVMAGYTAWIFLYGIIYFLIIRRRQVLWKSRVGNSRSSEHHRGQNQKMQLGAAISVSVIFTLGSVAFFLVIICL